MKITQCLPLVFITVLAGLVSCQRNAPVSSEGKTLSNRVKDDMEPAHEVEGGGSIINDTIPEDGSAEIREDTSKTKYYEPYYPIQKDTAMYHRFGDLSLKKDNLTGVYYVKNIGGYGYEGIAYYERYPGILNKQVHQGNKPVEVIFYNESRQLVVNRVDFKQLNPYLGKYKNIKHSYPSFEYYEAPYENEKHQYLNAEPDTFLTFYNGGHTSLNGYTTVTFSLVPVKGNKILSWETTTVILDRQGNVLAEHPEDNYILPALLSDDGRLLAYTYGRYPDNPYDRAPNGEAKVVDLHTGRTVLHKIPMKGYTVGANPNPLRFKGFVGIGQGEKQMPVEYIELDFINLNTRERYYYNFPIKEFRKAWDKYHSFIDLIHYYPFAKTTF